MTFEKWLKTFKKQKTPIGDLARDFIDTKYENIEESFRAFHPCDKAFDTYKEARRNYIIELANILHDELCNIIDKDKSEPTMWHQSLETLYNLKDKLADIDNYLEDRIENE